MVERVGHMFLSIILHAEIRSVATQSMPVYSSPDSDRTFPLEMKLRVGVPGRSDWVTAISSAIFRDGQSGDAGF